MVESPTSATSLINVTLLNNMLIRDLIIDKPTPVLSQKYNISSEKIDQLKDRITKSLNFLWQSEEVQSLFREIKELEKNPDLLSNNSDICAK